MVGHTRSNEKAANADPLRKRGGCRRNVERVTYDRGGRYTRVSAREPTPRFGVRAPRIDPFIDAFLNEREARGLSPETLRSYVSDLGVFAQWLRDRNQPQHPADRDVYLLRAYVAFLQRKPSKCHRRV